MSVNDVDLMLMLSIYHNAIFHRPFRCHSTDSVIFSSYCSQEQVKVYVHIVLISIPVFENDELDVILRVVKVNVDFSTMAVEIDAISTVAMANVDFSRAVVVIVDEILVVVKEIDDFLMEVMENDVVLMVDLDVVLTVDLGVGLMRVENDDDRIDCPMVVDDHHHMLTEIFLRFLLENYNDHWLCHRICRYHVLFLIDAFLLHVFVFHVDVQHLPFVFRVLCVLIRQIQAEFLPGLLEHWLISPIIRQQRFELYFHQENLLN